jgi:hypothetical protein
MSAEDEYVARDRPMDHADLVLAGDDAFRFLQG